MCFRGGDSSDCHKATSGHLSNTSAPPVIPCHKTLYKDFGFNMSEIETIKGESALPWTFHIHSILKE